MLNTDSIKSQIDIVDLISKDESLEKAGDTYRSGHEKAGHGSESGTCLDVSPKKQVYFCRNCGEKGDIFSWVIQRDSCSFIDAAKWLCETYHLPFEKLSPEETARFEAEQKERVHIRIILKDIFQFYHSNMTDEQRNYFLGRGISNEMINELLLGYASNGDVLAKYVKHLRGLADYKVADLYKTGLFYLNKSGASDRYQDRYIFPYWKNGETVFSIGRSNDPDIEAYKKYVKHLVHKPDKYQYVSSVAVDHCIWGVDTIHGATEIIITEGIVDAILAYQNGFAVLSPITTQFSNRDIERLAELTKHAETVAIINDNEVSGAGLKGALKTAEALFSAGRDVLIVKLPRPPKRDKYDLADYFADFSANDLRALIDEKTLDFIEYKIDKATKITTGRKQENALKDILRFVVKADPVRQERYIQKIVDAKLAKMNTLRSQLKMEAAEQRTGKKTTNAIADELIEKRYTKDDEITVVFQHGTWYEYSGMKYEERSRDEYDTEIIEKIRFEKIDVSQNLVTSVRLATQPLTIITDGLEAPFWRGKKEHAENIISLKNGLLNLDKLFAGNKDPLLPHTPDFFVLSSQPYSYNPQAECPRWIQYLDESLDDDEVKVVMQEFYGLCLTHDQRFHKFLFLQGLSRTGKGVAFTILQEMVGRENVSNVALRDFGGPFGLQPMLGKKLNINAEIPELDRIAEDILKEYVGGSTVINYNRKHLPTISTIQRARLAFSSNNYPNFRDRTEGLWNRMLLIPFNEIVQNEDIHLEEHLVKNELPGIFNWACAGYIRLLDQGKFSDSVTIKAEIDEYKEETIPAHQFIRSYLDLDTKGYAVHSKTLYRYYVLWAKCEGRGIQGAVSFGRDVAAYLKSEGHEGIRDMYGTYYPNVAFSSGSHLEQKAGAKERIVSRAIAMAFLRDDYELDEAEDLQYDRKVNGEHEDESHEDG